MLSLQPRLRLALCSPGHLPESWRALFCGCRVAWLTVCAWRVGTSESRDEDAVHFWGLASGALAHQWVVRGRAMQDAQNATGNLKAQAPATPAQRKHSLRSTLLFCSPRSHVIRPKHAPHYYGQWTAHLCPHRIKRCGFHLLYVRALCCHACIVSERRFWEGSWGVLFAFEASLNGAQSGRPSNSLECQKPCT